MDEVEDAVRPSMVVKVANVLEKLICGNTDSTTKVDEASKKEFLKFQSSYAPDVTIESYLERIRRYSRCSDACFVMALVYIDRLIDGKKLMLSALNVHRLLITAVMLAAKFHDDLFYNNAYYAKLGGLTLQELNHLEIELLNLLSFKMFVSDSAYGKYTTQLQSYVLMIEAPVTSNPLHMPDVHAVLHEGFPPASLSASLPLSHPDGLSYPPTLQDMGVYLPMSQGEWICAPDDFLRVPSPENPHADGCAYGDYLPLGNPLGVGLGGMGGMGGIGIGIGMSSMIQEQTLYRLQHAPVPPTCFIPNILACDSDLSDWASPCGPFPAPQHNQHMQHSQLKLFNPYNHQQQQQTSPHVNFKETLNCHSPHPYPYHLSLDFNMAAESPHWQGESSPSTTAASNCSTRSCTPPHNSLVRSLSLSSSTYSDSTYSMYSESTYSGGHHASEYTHPPHAHDPRESQQHQQQSQLQQHQLQQQNHRLQQRCWPSFEDLRRREQHSWPEEERLGLQFAAEQGGQVGRMHGGRGPAQGQEHVAYDQQGAEGMQDMMVVSQPWSHAGARGSYAPHASQPHARQLGPYG
ncbi:cyclin-domain-containing protein, partial [Ochromonadaceae sp. CCMP2298]